MFKSFGKFLDVFPVVNNKVIDKYLLSFEYESVRGEAKIKLAVTDESLYLFELVDNNVNLKALINGVSRPLIDGKLSVCEVYASGEDIVEIKFKITKEL